MAECEPSDVRLEKLIDEDIFGDLKKETSRTIDILNIAYSKGEIGDELYKSLFVANMQDTSVTMNYFQKLKDIAYKDRLTGLCNRRILDQIKKSPVGDVESIILLDIDNFGIFNKKYGMKIGDAVLTYMSDKLQSAVRLQDIVLRYGGEEIIVHCPDTRKEDALKVAEKCRVEISEPNVLNDYLVSKGYESEAEQLKDYKLTASFGVSDTMEGLSLDRTIYWADKRMRDAKKEGKNKVVSEGF